MSAITVKLTREQLGVINREVKSGRYTSPSDVVREALRLWLDRRITADIEALERAHSGVWDRDTTPEEEAIILRVQKKTRKELLAQRKPKKSVPRKPERA